MKDVYNGERREHAPKEVLVDFQNEEKDAMDADFSSSLSRSEDDGAVESDFAPGSKRHSRTQALKTATDTSSSKRYASPSVVSHLNKFLQRQRKMTGMRVITS